MPIPPSTFGVPDLANGAEARRPRTALDPVNPSLRDWRRTDAVVTPTPDRAKGTA